MDEGVSDGGGSNLDSVENENDNEEEEEEEGGATIGFRARAG